MATVRVRIAVVVDEEGFWQASGWFTQGNKPTDEEMKDITMDIFTPEGCEAVYFVEADLPLPSPVTVEGKVQQ